MLMVKKTIYVNPDRGQNRKVSDRGLTSRDRRRIARWEKRIARWEKRIAYALKNGVTPGFNAIDDGPEYKINEDPMDKVDKALATPFPRDVEKIEDEKYEDVMHRVVNHAHQRNPNKKWS
ncbi:transcriptional regulator [Escherichia coli]|nr:transcriptional regulator [Escherichia coli]